jgi:hypothetical protein
MDRKLAVITSLCSYAAMSHGWDDLESITAKCPTLFRDSAGRVECHLDIDTGINTVVLISDGSTSIMCVLVLNSIYIMIFYLLKMMC